MIEERCFRCGKVRLLKRATVMMTCRSCAQMERYPWHQDRWRKECVKFHDDALLAKNPEQHRRLKWAAFAGSRIRIALRSGSLPDLKACVIACVDCGRRAKQWEHRDYTRPLKVDPCCITCNKRRGPAYIPAFYPPKSRRLLPQGVFHAA